MRRLLPILTGVALVLGVVHLALSALSWRAWGLEALWFAGAGLAILVAGLLNVVMIRAERLDHIQKTAWLFANLALAGFFSLAWTVLQAPQVVAGGLVFILLSVGVAGQATVRT